MKPQEFKTVSFAAFGGGAEFYIPRADTCCARFLPGMLFTANIYSPENTFINCQILCYGITCEDSMIKPVSHSNRIRKNSLLLLK